jgi:predicted amidohydrolase
MSRCLPIAAVQAEPIPVDRALDVFAASAEGVAADFPQAELLIYPELYLCGLNGRAEERDAHMAEVAEPMDGPRIRRLRQIAGDLGRWLVPG